MRSAEAQVEDVIIGDRYALDARLGEGSYGAVWAARDLATGRVVAVKLLHRAHLETERVRARFQREATIVRALDHPNVAAAYDVVAHEDGIALVLQLVEGHTLRAELRQRALDGRAPSARAVASLAGELGRGLAYAHARGVVHRDLKPANVMLTPDAQAVILDFGLARFLEPEEEDARTTLGRILGTPMYMAPEQAAGEEAGPAADVFALACVLFEAATLEHAWLRDTQGARLPVHTVVAGELRAPNARGAIAGRIATSPDRLDVARLRPDLPRPLAEWIAAAGAVDPEARPSLEALLAAVDGSARLSWTPPPRVDDTDMDVARARSEEAEGAAPPSDELLRLAGALDPPSVGDEAPLPPPAAAPPLAPARSDRVYVAIALAMATLGLLLAWRLLGEQPTPVVVHELPAREAAPGGGAASASTATATLADRAALRTTAHAEVGTARTGTAPAALTALAGGPTTVGCLEGRDPDCNADERPPIRAELAPFVLDATEVTAAAYDACVARGACTPAERREAHCTTGRPELADHPINCVDAAQAEAFCAARGARLPTAAEWEHAARAHGGGIYTWGDALPTCARANMGGCGGAPARVGSRAQPGDVFADLAGNVWEWTAGGSPTRREIRGGSFYDLPTALRSSNRGWADPRTRVEQIGFRCTR